MEVRVKCNVILIEIAKFTIKFWPT